GQITDQNNYLLTNARQTILLEKASQSLRQAINAMELNVPADLIVEDLYDSWSYLKEILGEQAKEDLLDELFKRFCIGK
ncbi:MAG: tRNA uridine-5-carboxymethylaminomethyl(34) synthesis GTPase MnmE, partial [Faecalibacillus sp.]